MIYFHVSRREDGLLDIAFYRHKACLHVACQISEDNLDETVFGFCEKTPKTQLLERPDDEWWDNGCPSTEFTREISCH